MNTTANLVFAPLSGTNALYSEVGIDLWWDADIAETGETKGEAQWLQWIEFDDEEDAFDSTAADEMLRRAGYRRASEWRHVGDFAQAPVEPLR